MDSVFLSKQTYFNDGRIRDNCNLPKIKRAKAELFISIQWTESLLTNRFFFWLLSPSPTALLALQRTRPQNNKTFGREGCPKLWKLNNSLVDDEGYVNRIKENYTIIGEKYLDLDDQRLKWELIKISEKKGPCNCLLKNHSQNTTTRGIGYANPPRGTRTSDF